MVALLLDMAERGEGMKCIIAGSRKITDMGEVMQAIIDSGWRDEITQVVCGKAKGVDTCGERWATFKGVPVIPFPPEYKKYHPKVAPKMRNEKMAKYADALILVWTGDPKSGSADMLARAEKHGLKIYQHIVTETP